MSKREGLIASKPTKTYVEAVVRRLGYVRCWIDGFEAAGKKGPHASDALRQAQLLIKELSTLGGENG